MPRLDMRTLHASQSTPISVQAEFTVRGREIHLQYTLHDPNCETLDSLRPEKGANFPRADELWKTTCFEAFWGVKGQPGYWEFNISPSTKSWNVYVFADYRKPQPPTRSDDFQLTSVEASASHLRAALTSRTDLNKLEASLTAVIRTASGITYFACKQASPKPDFHRRETFIIGI